MFTAVKNRLNLSTAMLKQALEDGLPLDPRWAAYFLYLNKCGMNGLVRYNTKGLFNAPVGRDSSGALIPPLFDWDHLRTCAGLLTELRPCIVYGSFMHTMVVSAVKQGDLVYMDPPYLGGFVGYTSRGWTLEDVQNLAARMVQLVDRGATVIVSQPDRPQVRAAFDHTGFEIVQTSAPRPINSRGAGRGNVGELIIIGRPK
jgi:DNA adenine methylase